MKSILIITVNIVNNSPQPIRFRNLIKKWESINNITVLTKDNPKTEDKLGSRIRVVKVPYSRIGKLLISFPSTKVGEKGRIKNNSKAKVILRDIWKKTNINKFIFPDKYIFEYRSFKEAIVELLKNNDYDVIIISAYPFSMLKLAKTIKSNCRNNAKVIYDIGDPFFGNSVKFIIEPFHSILSKKYETKYLKYIDNLVVISNAVKRHYLSVFGDSLQNAKVNVIEQGIVPFRPKKTESNEKSNRLVFIYAGGFYKKLREPFELYDAIREINSINIHLRIFGNIYKSFLPDTSVNKFFYGGSITQKEVLNEFYNSDIIVFIDNAFGIQVPGKILEVISVKKPILFIYKNENSPTFEFIKGYKGVVYTKNNKNAIKGAIYKIIENKDKFDYDYDLSKYYWENLALKYSKLF